MQIVKLQIEGMTCDGCARHIEKVLGQVEGVKQAHISYPQKGGEVQLQDDAPAAAQLAAIVNERTPYRVTRVEVLAGPTSESADYDYDLIIIGGGSAAFAAAIEADGRAKHTLLVNDGLPIGGTCVNVGCVPSKFMIRAAEQVHRAGHSPFAGIGSVQPPLDFKAVVQQKRQLVGDMQQKKYLDVLEKLPNITFVKGRAVFTGPNSIAVGDNTYTAGRFIVATGSTTRIPDIPGLEEVGYLTNQSLFELEELPGKLIVLGAGYIALEIAQAWQRFGSRVQIIHRSERILRKEAADITEALHGFLTSEGVDIQLNTKVERVERQGTDIVVYARQNGREASFRGTHLLVATGTRANTTGMGLDLAGVELDEQGRIKVDSGQRTSAAHILAAGDCTNTPAFVYTAAREGKVAVENAFDPGSSRTDYNALPWVVFTDPQVAGAGLDEAGAQAAGINYETTVLPLSEVPRAAAAMDTRGFIKLIRDKSNDKIIGIRVLAPEGGELVMLVSQAIRQGMTASELADGFYPYLTLSEGIKLAAITFSKDISELSCCAN